MCEPKPLEPQEFKEAQDGDPAIARLVTQVKSKNFAVDQRYSGLYSTYRVLSSQFPHLFIENELLKIQFPQEPKKIIVPETLVERVLDFCHSGPDSAHLGNERLRKKC